MVAYTMHNWSLFIIVLVTLQFSRLNSECVVQENSALFIPICDIKNIFPEIENPKLDNFKNHFQINGNNLELLQSLDRENLIANQRCDSNKISNDVSNGQCVLMLELIGTGPRFYQIPILVADVNDNAPSFDWLHYNIKIPENSPSNKEVDLPQARDPDRGRNGTIVYHLQKSTVSYKFILLNPSLNRALDSPLKLKILQPFDKEIDENPQLVMIAKDLGSPSLSSTLILKIEIMDVNDHVPEFNQSSYRFNIPESILQGQSIGRVFAFDRDVSSRITIMMSPSASNLIVDRFIIASDGVISTKTALEYTSSNYEFRIPVIAVDGGAPVLTATTTVFVHITDVNDNSPVIEVTSSNPNNRLTIQENCPSNTYVAKITAKDKDYGMNGNVECNLDTNDLFNLEPIQNLDYRRYYKLITAPLSVFDREIRDNQKVTIVCNDKGVPSLSTRRPITILINDENDNAPIFPQNHISIKLSENHPIGTTLTTLKAVDKDIGINSQTKYKLSDDSLTYFNIDSHTGVITTRTIFDRETNSAISIKATAYDSLSPNLQSNVTIHVTILDENDNHPIFMGNLSFHVKENKEGYVGQVKATDADDGRNKEIDYFLITPSDTFHMTKSGEIIVQRKLNLDREMVDQYSLLVGARDRGLKSLTASTTVKITVDDINDNTPTFIRPIRGHILNISVSTQPGKRIFTVEAVDRDEGLNGMVIYSIRPQSFFVINSSDGAILLNSTLANENDVPLKLVVFAQDCGTPSLTATSSIILNYIHNGPTRVTVEENKAERRTSTSRDLVLSLGIGIVVLIFTCLVMLVSYFCVSIVIQKRREHNGNVDKDRGAVKSDASHCLCQCLWKKFVKDSHNKKRIISQVRAIPDDLMVAREQNYPMCFNRWEKSRGHCIDDDPLYSYREFTMQPVMDPPIYDHLTATIPPLANSYWQYNTIGHRSHRPSYPPDSHLSEVIYHQGMTYIPHKSHPDIVNSNSSDEVNRKIYEMSPSLVQSNLKLSILSHANYENEKFKYASNNNLESLEVLAQQPSVDCQPTARFAGYVVGSPCYANSFV